MFVQTSWPDELVFKQIRAVPSYHFCPEFALLVRQQIDDFKPDLIAVELPDLYQESFCRAVSFLPALSAVITPADEFIPISPEDSIVEAVRLACEKNIDIACVDLEVADDGNCCKGSNLVADSAFLERMDLVSFINLSAAKIADHTDNVAFQKREEHMAAHLQLLAGRYRRILFVCGMVHWRRIKARLSQKNEMLAHRFKKGGAVAAIGSEKLYLRAGSIPFRASCFEKFRVQGGFNLQNWLKELFTEAASCLNIKLSISDMADLLKYCRNQSILHGCLTPRIDCLADTGSGIISSEYGKSVYNKCLEYAFAEFVVPGPLKIVFDDNFYLDVRHQRVPLQLYHRSEYSEQPRLSSPKADKRSTGRNNPKLNEILKNPYRRLSDSWGRYGDEMDEEERFVATLERWACHKGRGDETAASEFSDGLLDGLDVAETIRDLVHGRLYVKEFISEEPRFSAVLVEFNDDFNNFGEAIYTYGRHKALAFTSPDRPNPERPGTASREFSLMLSFKRLIDNERLWTMSDQLYRLVSRNRINHREAIMRMALQHCRPEDMLVVAPQKSLVAYQALVKQIAPAGTGSFTVLRREDIWNPSCERIRRFNIYYYL